MPSTYYSMPLGSTESIERHRLLSNTFATGTVSTAELDPAIERFHKQLPDHAETALHSLPDVAKELGFAYVLVKDESTRFGLPSFKMAGASWAIYKTLCRHVGLSVDVTIQVLKQALQSSSELRLVTCTEGNWGRATARMARYLGVKARVYVPYFMEEYTQNLIRNEGAEVVMVEGADYDESVAAAIADAKDPNMILVLDVGFDGYHDIPQWVTDGYSVILREVDRQVAATTGGKQADLVTCSLGAGSWAQSIVAHYRSANHPTVLCSVEPDTAACFKESLHNGCNTSIKTGHTIMNGMNCGTVSSVAWPLLKSGIDWAIVVTDSESHACVQELQGRGINAGPCGAANLAALRRLCKEGDIQDRSGKTVVLFSTEGRREYQPPA